MRHILTVALVLAGLFSAQSAYAELEGWMPRYSYHLDDKLIGDYHYFGVSHFDNIDNIYDGYTLRYGYGDFGDKIALSYTTGFFLMSVDIGASWIKPDSSSDTNRFAGSNFEGPAFEVGFRFFVVYGNYVHTRDTTYISLGFGF